MKEVIQHCLMGIALMFLVLGTWPSISIPSIGQFQGFGQEVEAQEQDLGECLQNPPTLTKIWKRVLCRTLQVGTLATGVATIIKTVTAKLTKYGLKEGIKHLKKMKPVSFTVPNRILGIKIPSPPAGKQFTLDPADIAKWLDAGTTGLFFTLITATLWELVGGLCACWLQDKSGER